MAADRLPRTLIVGTAGWGCASRPARKGQASARHLLPSWRRARRAHVHEIGTSCVSASGEGCRARSFTTELSADGKTLLVHFRSFRVDLTQATLRRSRIRNRAVVLRSPTGLSCRVESFAYRGTPAGARRVCRHHDHVPLPSDRSRAELLRTELSGPMTVQLTARAAGELWSPCARIETNTSPAGPPLSSETALPRATQRNARTQGALQVELAWRSCSPAR